MNRLIKIIKDNAVSMFCIGLYAFLSNVLFGYFCPSMAFLGVPCPACGMTRAALRLLVLDFAGAYKYNPCIFLAVPIIFLYFVFAMYNRKLVKLLFYPLLVSVIISFFVFGFRLFNGFGAEPLVFNDRALLFIIMPLFLKLLVRQAG